MRGLRLLQELPVCPQPALHGASGPAPGSAAGSASPRRRLGCGGMETGGAGAGAVSAAVRGLRGAAAGRPRLPAREGGVGEEVTAVRPGCVTAGTWPLSGSNSSAARGRCPPAAAPGSSLEGAAPGPARCCPFSPSGKGAAPTQA